MPKLYVKKRDFNKEAIEEIEELIKALNIHYWHTCNYDDESQAIYRKHAITNNRYVSRTIWYLEKMKKYLEMKEGVNKCKATIFRKSEKNLKN